MHGRKREDYKAKMRDPKTAKVLSQKAEQWHVLMKELAARKARARAAAIEGMSGASEEEKTDNNDANANATTATTLALLGKALLVNPDPINLWNHRRELILWELERDRNHNNNNDNNNNNNTKNDDKDKNDESLPNNSIAVIADTIVHRERALTTTALERNPKAYGAWFHRKWVLQKFRVSPTILEEEIGLTSTFLMADERNFHCWNYRRFVVACLGGSWDGEWRTTSIIAIENETVAPIETPIEASVSVSVISTTLPPTLMGQQIVENSNDESTITTSTTTRTTTTTTSITTTTIPAHLIASEFEFTRTKITQNFSNFSAFHYRSQLLDLCHERIENNDDNDNDNEKHGNHDDMDFVDIMEERFDTEFRLVEDAVCTEPDDQTCWWYHAILLDKLVQYNETSTSNNSTSTENNNDNTETSNNNDSTNSNNNNDLLERFEERLTEQADLFREILEDSPDSKWVILGLFKVLQVLSSSSSSSSSIGSGGCGCGEDENENETVTDENEIDETDALLQKLQIIDPYRSNRYEELRSKKSKE